LMCRTSNNTPAAFDGLWITLLPLVVPLNAPVETCRYVRLRPRRACYRDCHTKN
jgi:hypothetical protein